jgi:hypothetical protein
MRTNGIDNEKTIIENEIKRIESNDAERQRKNDKRMRGNLQPMSDAI